MRWTTSARSVRVIDGELTYRRWSPRVALGVAVGTASALLLTLTPALAQAAPAYRKPRPHTQVFTSVAGRDVTASPRAAATALPDAPRPATAWPAAATGQVLLRAGQRASVPGTAVAVTGAQFGGDQRPVAVRTEPQTLSDRLGLAGVVLSLTGPAGSAATVEVDYSAWAQAGGGDWARRLKAVALPACALSTPQTPGCADPQPVRSVNDVRTHRLTITTPAGPAGLASKTDASAASGAAATAGTQVFAVTAGSSSDAGDYGATPPSASSTWQVANQTGSFTWSYPFRVPPAVNGPAPVLSIDYDSGSVDGRTAATNNQPSWIGEGHTLEPGYVERQYVPCAEDLTGGNNAGHKTGDLCWRTDNATLVLAGHSSRLVKDTDTGAWTLQDDDGSTIKRTFDGANDDNNHETWVLTTQDGTEYHFGQGLRSAGDTAGNSNATLTVPVAGNQPGEPCYVANNFRGSFCAQAWRWNLDYVVDSHDNTMSYRYAVEANNYGRDNGAVKTRYDRAGYLTTIEYGQRAGTEHTTPAPAKVLFRTAERCVTGSTTPSCEPAALTKTTAGSWPDVPFDLICADGAAACTGQYTPGFFTRKRLAGITTQVRAGTSYSDVDSWAFAQSFPSPGDGSDPGLWLNSIVHTGLVGGSAAMPSVTFGGVSKDNRVDGYPNGGTDGAPPLMKLRVNKVGLESGGAISVEYSAPQCVAGSNMPAAEDTNTKLCFPSYFTPEGFADPVLHYFHKYVVRSLTQSPGEGFQPALETYYTYGYTGGTGLEGVPAWHFDDNDLTPMARRTWSDWRGYDRVTVKTGSATGPQTAQQFLYMRGMNGDRQNAGGPRVISVRDSEGGTLVDSERLKGFVREQRTFNGVGGAEITGAISGPWISTVHGSDGLHSSTMLQTSLVKGRRSTSSNGVQRTLTTTTFNDATGLASTIDDAADTSRTSDDLCTRLTYTTANTAKNLVDNVARTETVSVRCTATPNRPGQVVSDVRNFYDGTTTLGAAPTRGDITRSELLSDGPNGTTVYKTKVRMTYDDHGRTLDTYDALNRKSSLSYTPATGGPLTATKSTNPLGHTNTTRLDPARGDPISELDSNNNKTELDYDPLGRLTAVWLPDRPRATATANLTFSYLVRKSGATAVTTQTLEHDEDNGTRYSRSTALYDGLMRPVQTQTQAPLQDKQTTPGRLISDTTYDARGLVVVSNGPYYNTGPVGTDFFDAADNAVPTQTKTTYDGAGRPTVEQFRSLGTDRWRTTTSYGGDRVTVTPPAGGTAATTITDLRGRAVELRQYKTNPPSDPADSATYNKTTYAYTPAGDLEHVTDPAGNDWSYSYDLRGRQISSTDPDSGTSTTGYDDADQPILTTDARGQALSTSYDNLGRRTELRGGSTTGPLRASWTYDTLADGKATSSTRWDNGNAYTTKVTGYDSMYRPTGGTVTIPAAEGALAGTYTTDIRYNADDGSIRLVGMPAAGDLPSEYIQQRYNELGQPTVVSGLNTYVAGASYNPYGELSQLVTGSRYGLGAFSTYNYTVDTHQLSQAILDRESIQPTDADFHYTYDPAGNLQQITDSPVNGTAGTECFNYDYLRRLTQAWTTPSGCAATPTQAAVGGPAPYWQSYTYDLTGNRTSRVDHTAAGDTTATYTYPAPGAVRPHAVTSITTTTTAPAATRTDAFGYNAAGDTTTRNIGGKPAQSLTWDAEDHLATVTSSTGTTSYLYDADGSRLIRRDPTATTLYLDNTEIRLATTPGATPKGTRYYTHAGATVAVRTATTLTTLFTDPHGTAEFALDNADNSSTRRRTGPFGDDRGTQPATWPTQQGFLGGTEDPTGLTHLGAREYDPARGRFISPDPIVAHQDPQRLNAYAYANNNPTTNSDPTGLMFPGDGGTDYDFSHDPPNPPPAAPAGGPGAGSPNGNDHRAGPPPTPTEIAKARVTTAEGNKNNAKRKVQEAAIEIVKVISDEVGLTAGLDCLTKGDISGCAETAVNILTAFAGGFAGKLLAKYGLPWKWAKAARLVRRIVGLADKALDGLRGWTRASRELDDAAAVLKTCNSFTAGTPVLLADGTSKPIEQVRVGDEVQATDPKTGHSGARPVTDLIRHAGPHTIVTITLADGSTLHATDHHPIWNATTHTYTDAIDLKPGQRLQEANGTPLTITIVKVRQQDLTAYNLTINDLHTYYAGTTPLLVHNNSCEVSAVQGAVGFAEGLGQTALTPGRLQHGTKNLTKIGVLPAWSGKASPGIIKHAFAPILERPAASFDHTLGDSRVRGFLGDIDGQRVAVFVYKEGPYQGQLASSSVPSANQLKMWGVG